MAIYESRDDIYLKALAQREKLYQTIASTLEEHHLARGADPRPALRILQLDKALSPRIGGEHSLEQDFKFNARAAFHALSAMELPATTAENDRHQTLEIHHPGVWGKYCMSPTAAAGCGALS